MSSSFPMNTTIDQGRDWYLVVTYNDASGSPINLTGYTASFAMAQSLNPAISLSLTSGAGITLGGTAGTISLHATYTQTSIPAGTYTAELVVTSGGDVETSLLKGQITVSAKVAN